MNYLMCYNHEYPLCCPEIQSEFKKNIFGKVKRLDITCECPECKRLVTYSFAIRGYKEGNQ